MKFYQFYVNKLKILNEKFGEIEKYITDIKGKIYNMTYIEEDSSRTSLNIPNEIKDYQIADIYHAYKLALTVLFLLLMYPNFMYDYDEKSYLQIIASYVLSVNSFNTFCNVRMHKTWNGKIHNEYVYEKLNVSKETKQMEVNKENIANLEINNISRHFEYLDKKYPEIRIMEKVKAKFGGESDIGVGLSISDKVKLCEEAGIDLGTFEGKDSAYVLEYLKKNTREFLVDMENKKKSGGKLTDRENVKNEAYKIIDHFIYSNIYMRKVGEESRMVYSPIEVIREERQQEDNQQHDNQQEENDHQGEDMFEQEENDHQGFDDQQVENVQEDIQHEGNIQQGENIHRDTTQHESKILSIPPELLSNELSDFKYFTLPKLKKVGTPKIIAEGIKESIGE